ncbi:MAG: hypothetical protein GY794_13940 [bacterium]|nr:hypothetical protein [bacterium]
MARVVRRRKNPLLPVLLVFVFLFVAASVMATLFYNDAEENKKKQKRTAAVNKNIISPNEAKAPRIKAITRARNKSKGQAPTVVAELIKRIDVLTRKITGSSTSSFVAVEQIESAIGKDTFVISAINKAGSEQTRQTEKIKELKTQVKNLIAEKPDEIKRYNTLVSEFKTKADSMTKTNLKLEADLNALASKHIADLKTKDQKWQTQVDGLNQEIDALRGQVTKLSEQVTKDKIRINIYEEKLRDKKKTKSITLAIREAGKIKEVGANRKVCYIPLGSNDRVVRGMTFRVYGPEGIPDDGEGHKASLTVIRVLKSVSQCRVTAISEDDPIAIGDQFANIAFDPTHQPVFVVEGRFDLSGKGRLTETGTREVIALIKRSGGKVTDKLTVDVDFVVMGPEPIRPPKLEDDAPGPVKKARELRMEEYNSWRGVLDKAISLNVPKLNTKRFLTLTGYEAVRRYEE